MPDGGFGNTRTGIAASKSAKNVGPVKQSKPAAAQAEAAPTTQAQTAVAPAAAPAGASDRSFGAWCLGLVIVIGLIAVFGSKKAPAKQGTSPALPPKQNAKWVTPGETVSIAGRVITGGMIYVGEGMVGSSRRDALDPALITPSARVSSPANVSGQGMPYWPSYAAITPYDRAAYLDWLAHGRGSVGTYIGFVFLYFYGLERRALTEASHNRDELTVIEGEVRRLLMLYGGNSSFHTYAKNFIAALALLIGRTPRAFRSESEDDQLLALGQYAVRELPVPVDVAITLVESNPRLRSKPAATKCPNELNALFRIRYREKFDDGIIPIATSAVIRPTYRPASSGFISPVTLPVSPIPRAAIRELQKLLDLAEGCAEDLAPYARYVGKHGTTAEDLLSRLALLPAELQGVKASEGAHGLVEVLERELAVSEYAAIEANTVLNAFKAEAGERVTKTIASSIAAAAQSLGFGFEPDIRFGTGTLKPGEKVVFFRADENAPFAASPQFSSAVTLLNLAMTVAAADGVITPDEEQLIRIQVEDGISVTSDERRRIRAYVRWMHLQPPKAAGLAARLKKVPPRLRESVARFMISVANIDGTVSPQEHKVLQRATTAMRVDIAIPPVSAARPKDGGLKRARISGPLPQDYKLPPPAPSPAPAGPQSLDMALVEKRIKETADVAALLAGVFSEEEESKAALEAPTRDDGPLDDAHHKFLDAASARASWPRHELEAVAKNHGLMLSGALETLNEAAFEHTGAPVFEGDDPVEVVEEPAKEMLGV